MKKLSSPPWLERLAARRVVVAVAVGVVCASLGVPRALGGNYELQVMPGQASSHDTPAAVELVRQVGIDC